eukprot:symbB.v1.2.015219.t1/scaffold1115.1/size137032/4
MGPLRDATQLMEMDLSKPISRGTGHDGQGHRHLGHDLARPRGESAQDPGGYGYNDYASYDGYGYNDYDHYGYDDGYGYNGYDGVGDESGGYDSYAGEDVDQELGAIPQELGPPAPGEAEALKEEQETEALKECMAKCPVWDPLATAKPEDLQHASLVVLQRLARPEHRLTPSLRRASAAVDAAGRSLERWVRKRQDLARELPKLQQIMTQCKSLQDERDAEQLDDDLQAISAKTKLARQQAKAKKEETELAQESMVMQDVGHMQGKADRWALNQAMQEQDRRDAMENSQVTRAVNGYNQQGADFQQRQMEEACDKFCVIFENFWIFSDAQVHLPRLAAVRSEFGSLILFPPSAMLGRLSFAVLGMLLVQLLSFSGPIQSVSAAWGWSSGSSGNDNSDSKSNGITVTAGVSTLLVASYQLS